MLSYRLGSVNDFHWGFKPVLSYSKPHTFSTSLGEEKERKMHLISPTTPLRMWTKRQESKKKQNYTEMGEREGEREF